MKIWVNWDLSSRCKATCYFRHIVLSDKNSFSYIFSIGKGSKLVKFLAIWWNSSLNLSACSVGNNKHKFSDYLFIDGMKFFRLLNF
jgi:hypothetical protein